jgi:hypothetical protein
MALKGILKVEKLSTVASTVVAGGAGQIGQTNADLYARVADERLRGEEFGGQVLGAEVHPHGFVLVRLAPVAVPPQAPSSRP